MSIETTKKTPSRGSGRPVIDPRLLRVVQRSWDHGEPPAWLRTRAAADDDLGNALEDLLQRTGHDVSLSAELANVSWVRLATSVLSDATKGGQSDTPSSWVVDDPVTESQVLVRHTGETSVVTCVPEVTSRGAILNVKWSDDQVTRQRADLVAGESWSITLGAPEDAVPRALRFELGEESDD